MAYMLREGNVTIVHCDGDRLRAIFGVQEFFALPSVTLDATYAISKSGNKGSTTVTTGETSTSRAPSVGPAAQNGDISMVEGGDAISAGAGAGAGSGTVGAEIAEDGWLVGEELVKVMAESGAEERYEQRWPFRVGSGPQDWEGRAYVLAHLLTLLGHKIASNTSPLLLIPPPSPPSLPLPDQALWAQLAFEELNVPALSILPASLATTYALGSTSGIILNIGRSRSEITVITDSIIRWECNTTVQVGYEDCETWFEGLLMLDEGLDKVLREASGAGDMLEEGEKRKLVKEVANVIWTECTGDDLEVTPADGGAKVQAVLAAQVPEDDSSFDVAKKLVGETGLSGAAAAASHKSKKTAAAAATAAANKAAADAVAAAQADVITINIPSLPEKDIIVGQVRHRLCEPLLKGTERSGGDTVWEGMGRAVGGSTMSPGDKMAVWEGVGVVGELARIKSFSPALITYLTPFLLSSADLPSDTQAARIRLLSIPDYFANFKGATTELAPFLGGTMVAKVAFSDQAGKHCITKVDYNAKGPAAVYSIFAEQDR